MEFLEQDEIDALLNLCAEQEDTLEKFNSKSGEEFCDICIENIPIEFSKEIILLANRLGASSAIIHFRNNK